MALTHSVDCYSTSVFKVSYDRQVRGGNAAPRFSFNLLLFWQLESHFDMRKRLIFCLISFLFIVVSCKADNDDYKGYNVGDTEKYNESGTEEYIMQYSHYKMYPTDNIWTFLKLDTSNGMIWQVQFSVKGDDYRFETPINTYPLNRDGNEPDRFELYPTKNMYNFILLDTVDGRVWQVQWSMDADKRFIIPI